LDNVKQAYSIWAEQYDSNKNKTRDLEGLALRVVLSDIPFERCLEIGCGTGKNTLWLLKHASHITAVDLSEQMLAKARLKIHSPKVSFQLADIKNTWDFVHHKYDLVVFSLVLEHIELMDTIFEQASSCLTKNGHIYIGELHPYKQYAGTKARFDTEAGRHIVTCFNHHVSDFTEQVKKYDLDLVAVNEYFDNDDKNSIPRILTVLLRKKN
jgi:ubiquinone/menaquinone biosynthesis C-methylase UbiE